MLHSRLHAGREQVDFLNGFIDLIAAVVGALVGVLNFLRSGIGVLRNVLHAVGYFVDGSRHQLHAFGLGVHVTQAVATDLVQLLAGAD